ncbi:MAG: hypothetical protein GEU95_08400 [Rhizobiales bacterium]|nr:hypothetical protein [Hyphomicrobiales bacterium]
MRSYLNGGKWTLVKEYIETESGKRISARGNGYTSNTTVQDYALLKAAETTKAAGATHFVVVNAANASSTGSFTTPGSAQTTFSGNTAYTSYQPGQTHTFIKPGQDAYIRVVRSRPGERPPAEAISADEIIQFVGARVKRS